MTRLTYYCTNYVLVAYHCPNVLENVLSSVSNALVICLASLQLQFCGTVHGQYIT